MLLIASVFVVIPSLFTPTNVTVFDTRFVEQLTFVQVILIC